MSAFEFLDTAQQAIEMYKDGVPLRCTMETVKTCAVDGTDCVVRIIKTCDATIKPLFGKIWGARINIPF